MAVISSEKMAYLTPDDAPLNVVYRIIAIPDDKFWKAIVNGAFLDLIYARNFEQFGTATPEDCAAVFASMYDDFTNSESDEKPVAHIIGEIKTFAFTTPPAGWLHCNGGSYLRATYPALFAAIGTLYGSVDGTHFSIPQSQGRTMVGYWPSAGDYELGVIGGAAAVNITVANLPAHDHNYLPSGGNVTILRQGVGGTLGLAAGGTAISNLAKTQSAGSDVAIENRQPYSIGMMAIYSGVI